MRGKEFRKNEGRTKYKYSKVESEASDEVIIDMLYKSKTKIEKT